MEVKIGTRASNLAKIQAYSVKDQIEKNSESVTVKIVPISTKGDRILDRPIDQINEKGVFVKEIERALIDKEIDIAVHSMKDMPSQIDDRLTFVNPPPCQPPEDVFIGNPNYVSLEDLNDKIIGTGSNRRIAQLHYHLDKVHTRSIRGNIETRMNKVKDENLDGTILARAGIIRAGYEDRINFILEPTKLIPSPCQGILAIEVRKSDQTLIDFLNNLADPWASLRMEIERTYQAELGANCESPIGIYTSLDKDNNTLTLYGAYATDKNSSLVYHQVSGPLEQKEELAIALAKELRGMVE